MDTKQKYVWRMQDKDGKGPYNGSNVTWHNRYDYNLDLHPTPYIDGLGMYFVWPEQSWSGSSQSWKFAFPNKKAANKWFDALSRKELEAQGFAVKRLKVNEKVVSKSGRQCIFR